MSNTPPIVSDPYQDGSELGSGGFGRVCECLRVADGTSFAKKILTDVSPQTVQRFRSEVRALSKLVHPRIVRVEYSSLETPPFYYVMPRYRTSLAVYHSYIHWRQEDISKIMRGLCEAMSYAHSQGILHRDLKPHNVLMNSVDDFVVSDFGLCRIEDPNVTQFTQTGDQMGTQGYSAPEQFVDAKRSDHRSDIFALGRIFLFLHTGLNVHQGADINSIPPQAAIIVNRCTQQNPERRFQSVAELMETMQSLEISSQSIAAPQRLEKLAAEIGAKEGATLEELNQLATYLVLSQGEETMLHDVVVALPAGTLGALYRVDPNATNIAIDRFAKVAIDTSWPFDYTDRIGSVCARLTREVESERIRGLMAGTAAVVGISHNRFAVLDVAKALLLSCTSNESALEAARILREANKDLYFMETTEIGRLNPIIAVIGGSNS